ncbi:unnamed protein product [Prorocentrum cordatum]|uniref:Uncharacterized protein n=1 Tax=Prorocentrum cordatum TaxID=2364126 RepID=A0ABN9VF14_9DINO|nr:unnamed protein product [Polarella glacialis]
MGMRRGCFALACFLYPALAQLIAKEDPECHADISDSRLVQISFHDGESTLEARIGGWLHGHSRQQRLEHVGPPPPAQPRGVDHAGSEFTQCGQTWQVYEQVVWTRFVGLTHHVACASVNDDSTIGICRSDNVGHDHWEYCASAPPNQCDGMGKLWFVFCTDIDRAGPSPTPAPTTPAPTSEAPDGGAPPDDLFLPSSVAPTSAPTTAPSPSPTVLVIEGAYSESPPPSVF